MAVVSLCKLRILLGFEINACAPDVGRSLVVGLISLEFVSSKRIEVVPEQPLRIAGIAAA